VASITLTVDCAAPPLLGTISGTVVSGAGDPLPGVSLVAAPTGLGASGATTSGALGEYSLTNIPVADGTGVLLLSGLPGGCSDPGPIPYSGLTTVTPLTLTVVIDCP
jgi:hypothetical protein